jgi:transcriptional regulator with XRE-family HTH domain
MNQIDTGKFIASCRKEKGLTQAQLAEKLNITDRAVSKWETGKCMPDSSIMLELCNILGVTVNELLSGERIEMNNYEEKVNENLIELKRKDENNMKKNTIISTIYTIAMVIGILVCCICDIAISGTLTWSLIVLSSILVTWIVSFPVVFLWIIYVLYYRLKERKLLATGITFLFAIPFTFLISGILSKNDWRACD